jgi:hypothetical protein
MSNINTNVKVKKTTTDRINDLFFLINAVHIIRNTIPANTHTIGPRVPVHNITYHNKRANPKHKIELIIRKESALIDRNNLSGSKTKQTVKKESGSNNTYAILI